MKSCMIACTLLAFLALWNVPSSEATLFSPQHCTWHGTAPFCMPTCPMGKKSVHEDKCGPNKILCCQTGVKKICCPNSLTIDAAGAIAIAKE